MLQGGETPNAWAISSSGEFIPDDVDAVQQVQSGEIWGKEARCSNSPSVKAYRNQIPAKRRGIEFTTPLAPHPGSGSPVEARWYYPHTTGVVLRADPGSS